MNNKIDVLIPIFNVERYLKQCLDSIINQTFNDIHIICINDGSTDNSSKILHEYAKKDNRIEIIEKDNCGYGAALNSGLDIATAPYIGIVEPDDFIDSLNYYHLYDLAQKTNQPDIVKFAYFDFFENEDGTQKLLSSQSSSVPSHIYPFRISEYPDILLYHPSIWSGIYSLNFIKKNNIRFVEAPGAAWTDNPFFIESLCNAEKIIWSNQKHYYYRRTNPTSSSNLIKDCSVPLQRGLELLEFIKKHPQTAQVENAIYKRCIIYIDVVIHSDFYNSSEQNELINRIISNMSKLDLKSEYYTEREKTIYTLLKKVGELK